MRCPFYIERPDGTEDAYDLEIEVQPRDPDVGIFDEQVDVVAAYDACRFDRLDSFTPAEREAANDAAREHLIDVDAGGVVAEWD